MDSWVRKIHWRKDRLPTPVFLGFPCGSAGKESAHNAGDLGSIPGLVRSRGEGLPEFAENIILGIIENSPQFESETIGLMTSYKLTWSELTTMQSRIERILYDSGQAMPKCDIEVVYNRLLRENGMSDPEVFQIKNSKNIHELYEGGTWIWKEFL